MFGIKYIKFQPSEYVIQYQKGTIKRQGTSLSFYFFAPTTSLVMLPVGSTDIPFMFEVLSGDFQTVTVQGNLTYRIKDMMKTSELLNFTYDYRNRGYLSDDPRKLSQRVMNIMSVLVKKHVEKLNLQAAIKSTETVALNIYEELQAHNEITNFGLEILGFNIRAISPTKETARALEAHTREEILKKADEAIYERRNNAILQERKIKENELNTEITIVDKKREIKEAELESELLHQQSENKIKEEELSFNVQYEESRKELVDLEVENHKRLSEAKTYELHKTMDILRNVDQKTLQALASIGMNSSELIALAFQDIANNASKIGELNISPDLLNTLSNRT